MNPLASKIPEWQRRFGIFALLYLLSLLVYLGNQCANPSIDTIPARYLSLSLLREGNLDLNEYKDMREQTGLLAMREYRGRWLSDFPVGAAFPGAFYYWLGMKAGLQAENEGMIWLEKWAGANIAALAAALFWFLLLRTGAGFAARLIVWIVFAFGSPNWMPCSQGLWQHAPAEALLILGLLAFPAKDEESKPIRFLLAGFFLGLSAFMRPTSLAIFPVWMVVSFVKNRKGALLLGAGVFLGLTPFLYYHLKYCGFFHGGGYFNLMIEGKYFNKPRPLYYLASHLFSPSRGVLVFVPFLFLVIISLMPNVRKFRPPVFSAALWGFSALALISVIISFRKWWTGYGYGPRSWSEVMPFLLLLTLPAVEGAWKRRWGRAIVLALAVYSIGVQAIGAWRYDVGWDDAVQVDKNPEACWKLYDNTILYCLTGGASHAGDPAPASAYTLPKGVMDMGKPEYSHYLYAGFYPQENWGVWSRGHYPARILFHLPEKKEGKLIFQVAAHSSLVNPKQITLRLNGRLLGRYQFGNHSRFKWEPEYFVLDIPAGWLSGGLEQLTMTSSHGNFESAGFSRFYGFAFMQFGWLSNEDFAQMQQQAKKKAPSAK